MSKGIDVREKYEQLKNSNLDQELKKLEIKAQEKTISGEEYKKYNRLLKVKQNMPKIENILEYRDILTNDLKEIEKEIETIEQLEKAREERKKLEDSLTKMFEEKDNLQKKLKKVKKPEEKQKLEESIKELDAKIDDNNNKFTENQHIINESENRENDNSMGMLKKAKENTITKISKCNMVARNLINGLSWNSIEINLDKWKDRKYTANKENSRKMKNKRDARKSERTEEKDKIGHKEGFKKIVNNIGKKIEQYSGMNDFEEEETKEIENEGDNLPVEVNEDNKKHSIFSRIKNWFIKKFKSNKVTNEIKEEEISSIKDEKNGREDFKKYLKEIAEKGYEQVEKDHNEEKTKNAKEKFEKMKEEAYNRETEKYGKDYADRSKTSKDEEGR